MSEGLRCASLTAEGQRRSEKVYHVAAYVDGGTPTLSATLAPTLCSSCASNLVGEKGGEEGRMPLTLAAREAARNSRSSCSPNVSSSSRLRGARGDKPYTNVGAAAGAGAVARLPERGLPAAEVDLLPRGDTGWPEGARVGGVGDGGPCGVP
mgnify:CR=1 FL=1